MYDCPIMIIGEVNHNNMIYPHDSMSIPIPGKTHKILSVNCADDLRDFIYRDCGIVVLGNSAFGILPPGKNIPPYQSMQCDLKECVSYINQYHFKKMEE